MGSRCGPFAPALQLLERGEVEVLPMIDAEYPLAEGLQAMAHAGRRGGTEGTPPNDGYEGLRSPPCNSDRRSSIRRRMLSCKK